MALHNFYTPPPSPVEFAGEPSITSLTVANDITVTTGDLTLTAGDATLAAGDLTLTAGDLVSGTTTVIDASAPVPMRMLAIPVAATDYTAGSEEDTGVDLPNNALVLDCFIKVTATHSAKTVEVGLLSTESGGDANGFLGETVGVSLATAGVVRGYGILDAGGDYFVSNTRGALLSLFHAGTDTPSLDRGFYIPRPYPTNLNTAKSISYTVSSGTTTAAFTIYVRYLEL